MTRFESRIRRWRTALVLRELANRFGALTGQRAFAGDSLDAIRHAVLHSDVTAAHLLNPKVDKALSDIVARAMAATHSATRSGSAIRQAPKAPRCTRSLGQPQFRLISS